MIWFGCNASHESLTTSLEKIAKSDLQDILLEVPAKAKASVLSKPYFLKTEYEEFKGDSSRVFQARATLFYFYLDPKVGFCQVRKYRYRTTAGIWDRYEVKLIHIPAKYTGSEGQ